MLIAIPDLLDAAAVATLRATIDAADWADGNATSGHQSALAKRNSPYTRSTGPNSTSA